MKEIFTKSDKFKQEYCASIVKIGELKPIDGSDFLAQTIVDGYSIVVRKDECKEGDIMFYCENETEINHNFLAVNNLFELSARELNLNYNEVESLIKEGKNDDAKKLVGFFNKHGRVKMIKLRGCPSMGFLFKLDTLANWDKTVSGIDLEPLIGTDFDTINGKEFIKAYIPNINQCVSTGKCGKNNMDKKIKRFDVMIDGEFHFHYDSAPLQKNMFKIKPTDVVTISVKEHGTSFIFGNIKMKKKKYLKAHELWYNRIINRTVRKMLKVNKKVDIQPFISKKIKNWSIGYGDIYSSRSVIKNQYINENVGKGYYKTDVWGDYYNILKGKIPNGVTIYGEITGYETNRNTGIQSIGGKVCDYGCEPGTNMLMIYRVSIKDVDGKVKELNVCDVKDWTVNLISKYPELSKNIRPINILYNGTLMDLYPDVDINGHWHENILELMKNDTVHFGMEMDEPMCKNKMPREGVVIRIDDDEFTEAFKLKTLKFLGKEGAEIDSGKIDIEMSETNY